MMGRWWEVVDDNDNGATHVPIETSKRNSAVDCYIFWIQLSYISNPISIWGEWISWNPFVNMRDESAPPPGANNQRQVFRLKISKRKNADCQNLQIGFVCDDSGGDGVRRSTFLIWGDASDCLEVNWPLVATTRVCTPTVVVAAVPACVPIATL